MCLASRVACSDFNVLAGSFAKVLQAMVLVRSQIELAVISLVAVKRERALSPAAAEPGPEKPAVTVTFVMPERDEDD